VTAVGEKVFSAAIYTDASAKDDWRRLQTTAAVQFRKETLPEGVDEHCVQYLGKMGLKFGAFDFIETPDGEVVFLECNPNGQYGWLEEELGLPISEAVTLELIKIARQR
jgi:glutathione synthase/RimK-type ligase-like ATP-grasp enzyme